MKNYKVRIKVEIEECEEEIGQGEVKKVEGEYQKLINEQQAESIDKSEKALLETNYQAVREALSEHMERMSKKKQKESKKEK